MATDYEKIMIQKIKHIVNLNKENVKIIDKKDITDEKLMMISYGRKC